jgi:hypothetical protein
MSVGGVSPRIMCRHRGADAGVPTARQPPGRVLGERVTDSAPSANPLQTRARDGHKEAFMSTHPHRRRRSLGVAAALSLFAVTGAACGGGSMSGSGSSTAGAAAAAAPTTTHEMTAPAQDGKPGFSKAVDLRLALNRLLGEHMLLAGNATQVALLGGKAFQADAAALQANTDDLAAAIGGLYGTDAKQAFASQWNAHNGYFVNYTTATAKDDAAAKQVAVDGLMRYQKDFGSFLAGATGLPAGAVQAQLAMHVTHTAKVVDTFGAKDYAGSYANLAMGYAHTGSLGDILAGAIATQKALGSPTGDAADLRVRLDDLLAEHAALAIVAMERGFDGSPDFQAAADELDKNTMALGDLIGSAFGADAEATFVSQWRAHIGYFVNYTTALAKGDRPGQDAAKRGLDGYVKQHGAFLAGATGLPAAAVEEQLRTHVDELLKTIDDDAAGDDAAAAGDARMAFAHMYAAGDALAGGIIATKGLM